MKSIIIFVLLTYCSCQILAGTSSKTSCLEHKDFTKIAHCISKRETSKCYNGGCITCILGRCMQSCKGAECESCPSGSCCDGKNCNACMDGVCCQTYECNKCIHECKLSCITPYCKITCTQSCISSNKRLQKENENVLNDETRTERNEEEDDYYENEKEDGPDNFAVGRPETVGTPCSQGCTGSCSTGATPCSANCGRNPGSSCSSNCNSPCSSSCTSSCNSCCSNSCGSSCGNTGCGATSCNTGCSSGSSKFIQAMRPSCSNGCSSRRSNCQA